MKNRRISQIVSVPELPKQKLLGEVGATPKLLSLGIQNMGKETPGIISNGVFWKPGQLSFKHTKQFPEIFFRLGAGAKNTKNGDFTALPRNCG